MTPRAGTVSVACDRNSQVRLDLPVAPEGSSRFLVRTPDALDDMTAIRVALSIGANLGEGGRRWRQPSRR